MRPRILKQELILSEFQKQVLVGHLLGDGHLETWKNAEVARLKVEQGFKQEVFVNWLFEVFRSFVKSAPRAKKGSVYFNTLGVKQLFEYRNMFYSNGKKIIPENIDTHLSPISLAVWFMGDGSIKSKQCNGRIINTHGYTKAEIEKLCQILKDKFTLRTSIRRQKDGLQIYISAKSAGVLTNLVSPYLLPIFNYKLPKFRS
jgi:hypothetical protein